MPSLGDPITAGRTAEIYAWENDCILKLIRANFPAHLADQEWRHSELAWSLGAPAPRPVALVEVDGRRGVVFQRIHGPNMVEALEGHLSLLDPFARQLGQLHARLHQISAPSLPSLRERIYNNLGTATLLDEKDKPALLALLTRLPEPDTLVHGDFHLQNILLSESGPLVIDWEGSMHGDPAGDVANTCLWIRGVMTLGTGLRGWIFRQIGRRFERVYLAAYQKEHGPVANVKEWLALLAASQMNEENRAHVEQLRKIVKDVAADNGR